MFGETITHTGAFETLDGIMIMLGFRTTMSGKSIIDLIESSRDVSNPYPFSFQKQFHHREEIQRLDQEMVFEVREPVPLFFLENNSHLTCNQNLDREKKRFPRRTKINRAQ
jgi:hypothetical protein